MLGRRSPDYLQYKGLGQFSFVDFEMDSEGRFYIGFEIDPKIYVYDHRFSPLYSFGVPGIDMDTDYTDVSITGNIFDSENLESIQEAFDSDRSEKGYYKNMKFIEERNILFRSYAKNSKSDGLQI